MGAYLSSPITTKEIWEGRGVTVKYGGSAMQGWRRTMEDAHLAEVKLDPEGNTCLFGVFDGHGGAEVAKFCQRYMVKEFQALNGHSEGDVEEALVRVFHRMDEMLRDQQYLEEIEKLKIKEGNEDDVTGEDSENGAGAMDAMDLLRRVFQLKRFISDGAASGEGNSSKTESSKPVDPEEALVQAGCTAVVAIKKDDKLYVANAGDSRGVLCRGNKAVALSEDHKPANDIEKNRIIAAGGFLSDVGGVCRVNGNLNLSRAIGDLRYKTNNELPAAAQIITAEPDIMKIQITSEDRFFVLACDGVWDVMSNQDVVDFVAQRLDQGMEPAQIACAMLDACLANDPKEARGIGCDNMTAIVVLLNPKD